MVARVSLRRGVRIAPLDAFGCRDNICAAKGGKGRQRAAKGGTAIRRRNSFPELRFWTEGGNDAEGCGLVAVGDPD